MYDKYLTYIRTKIDAERISHALNTFGIDFKTNPVLVPEINTEGNDRVREVKLGHIKKVDNDTWRFSYTIKLTSGGSISGMVNEMSYDKWLALMIRDRRDKRLEILLAEAEKEARKN
jgi:hypothetical protein